MKESPCQFAARLFTALEELVEQEGMYLRGGFFDLVVDSRRRSAPLVKQLGVLAREPGMADFAPQVAALLERCAIHDAFLQGKMLELTLEIRRIDQARHRTSRVAPAYASFAREAAPQFQAAG